MKRNDIEKCNICPRKCNVNRAEGKKGFCNVSGKGMYVTRASMHMWEEPVISGDEGSGTIFFAGCNLKCVYCQNKDISREEAGRCISESELAKIMIMLQNKGANNINLVTPTHYANGIIEAVKIAKNEGLNIPIVYNTSGYESVETIKRLDGTVDVYLTDFKYFDEDSAYRYSKAADYANVAKDALSQMHKQIKETVFNDKGIMTKGIIVRHLLLPGRVEEAKKIVKYVYDTYGDDVFLSLMNQFTPINLNQYPEINKTIDEQEYDSLVDYAIDIGVSNGFIQEGETAKESFIPSFSGEGLEILD